MKKNLLLVGLAFSLVSGSVFAQEVKEEQIVQAQTVVQTEKTYTDVILKNVNKETHTLTITTEEGDIDIKIIPDTYIKNTLNNTKVSYRKLIEGKKIEKIKTTNNVATLVFAKILPPFNY